MSRSGLSSNGVTWLAQGERGISSNTIFTHLTGIDALRGWHPDVPYDLADLRRCRLLLDACPDLAAELSKMREVSSKWAALVERWGELCKLMDEESPNWRKPDCRESAPKTDNLIADILARSGATKPKKRPRKGGFKDGLLKALIRRDGKKCFYCGNDTTEENRSLEHLVPLAHGGPNHLSNLVLAHSCCNSDAGHLSVMEKIRLRDQIVYGA